MTAAQFVCFFGFTPTLDIEPIFFKYNLSVLILVVPKWVKLSIVFTFDRL